MKLRFVLPVVSLAVAIAALVGIGSAYATESAPVSVASCGAVVTQDVLLVEDLKDCGGNGLVVGANDLTIDLNGHTIEGVGRGAGILASNHSNLTIEGGRLTHFSTGVLIDGGSRQRLAHLTADHDLVAGIKLSSSHSLVTHSTFSENGSSSGGSGVYLDDAGESRLAQSTVAKNDGVGVRVSRASRESIVGNDIVENHGGGVYLRGGQTRVSRNQLACQGKGIDFSGRRNRVTGNNIVNPSGSTMCPYGIYLAGGSENLVLGNQVADTAQAAIDLAARGNGSNRRNVVQDNVMFEPGRNGLLVGATVLQTLVSQNVSRRAKVDGFKIWSPATKLVGNLAVSSGGVGIFAVPGVEDGGGNSAHGNHAEPQCRNLHCG